jgi:hypothetical protein
MLIYNEMNEINLPKNSWKFYYRVSIRTFMKKNQLLVQNYFVLKHQVQAATHIVSPKVGD